MAAWIVDGIGTFQNTHPPMLQYTTDGYYNVTLYTKTSKGCNDTATWKLTVDCDSSYMIIPNVFSPNGDDINTSFKLKVRRYTNFKITILDRWGKKVFYSEDFNYSWNGKLNNIAQDCDEGTYYYLIEGRNKNNELKEFKGFLELVR